MISQTIPQWNEEGYLPPIDAANPTSKDRSPYACVLIDFIERFGTSAERLTIMEGFLRYRVFLHSLGIQEGFHWINGSFTEDKERLRGSAPKDLDVVTYFKPPEDLKQSDLNEEQLGLMFDPQKTKERFHVDGMIMPFGEPSTAHFIEQSTYWHGLFSHTRTGIWKGFLRIPLSNDHDTAATDYLTKLRSEL